MRAPPRVARSLLAAMVVLIAGALLVRAFWGTNLHATLRAVLQIGPLAPIAWAPWLAGIALDAAGIRILLSAMGHRVPFRRLLPFRIATEALHLTAPAGFLVADTAMAGLLAAREGVPMAEGAVLAVARKWLVMRAHAVYIAAGALLGGTILTEVSRRDLGGGWLPWAIGGSALAPLALSLGLGAGFRGHPTLFRLQSLAARLPWRAVRERAARWCDRASTGDAMLGRIGAEQSATWTAALSFLGCWLFEAADTAILLRLLGARADFAFAMGAEVGISMLRSIGNVVPAGLGIQDAGYATLLPAVGVAPDAAAAFVLLKRAKELVWIGVGYGLLVALRRGALAPQDSASLSLVGERPESVGTAHGAAEGLLGHTRVGTARGASEGLLG